jgi:hypothetical protein
LDIESYLQEYLLKHYRVNLAVDPAACERLQSAAEEAEKELANTGRAHVVLHNLLRRGDEMVSLDLEVTREDLQKMEKALQQEAQTMSAKAAEEAKAPLKSEHPVMMILGHTSSSLLPRLGALSAAIFVVGGGVGGFLLRQSIAALAGWLVVCLGLSIAVYLKQLSPARRLWIHEDLLILRSLISKQQQGIALNKLMALKVEETKGRRQLKFHLKNGDTIELARQLPLSQDYNFPAPDLEKLENWLRKQRVQVQR